MFCPHCIYVFCIYLRTNSDLCHLQHKPVGFYSRDEKCLLRGTNWVFKYSSLRFVFKELRLLKLRTSSCCFSCLCHSSHCALFITKSLKRVYSLRILFEYEVSINIKSIESLIILCNGCLNIQRMIVAPLQITSEFETLSQLEKKKCE